MQTLSPEKTKEFNDLAYPLMSWLAANWHPHTSVILDSVKAELVEGVHCAQSHIYDGDLLAENEVPKVIVPGKPTGECVQTPLLFGLFWVTYWGTCLPQNNGLKHLFWKIYTKQKPV